MVSRRSGRLLLATAVMLLATGGAMAGVAHGSIVVNISGPGLGSAGPVVTGTSSIDYSLTFDHVAPIDMAVSAVPPGTVLFNTIPVDTINNHTGPTWTDYHFLLGSGSGDTFTPFTAATNQGLDFLASPAPFTSAAFSTFSQTTDGLTWFGLLVPDGGGIDFAFEVSVPSSVTGFTLRQFPSAAAPEPSTLFLLGLGIAGAPAIAWRGARRK